MRNVNKKNTANMCHLIHSCLIFTLHFSLNDKHNLSKIVLWRAMNDRFFSSSFYFSVFRISRWWWQWNKQKCKSFIIRRHRYFYLFFSKFSLLHTSNYCYYYHRHMLRVTVKSKREKKQFVCAVFAFLVEISTWRRVKK